jgi:hypothetical protein
MSISVMQVSMDIVYYIDTIQHTLESLDEKVTILRNLESADLCAENLNTETVEYTHLVESDSDVQRALTTECEHDAIRALLFEDVGDIIRGDRKEIDF